MRLLTLLLALGLASCSPAPSVQAGAPDVLRFSGIPDADKAEIAARFEVVARWLEEQLGLPVEYVHAPDYTGAVTALAANKVDLVWLGGVTAVQAEERTEARTVFLATRERDLSFKSYFVANRARVEAGDFREVEAREPMPLAELAALRPALAQARFSFGSKSSTSGHVMPRHFLELPEVGIDPERDFRAPAGFQLQGGHSATLQAVASGAVDAGAVSYASWELADADTRARAPVVYVTPEYVDYCLVSHERLGDELNGRLREAFVGLDRSDARQREVLEAFGAERFVVAEPHLWDGIRQVLRSARERGILE